MFAIKFRIKLEILAGERCVAEMSLRGHGLATFSYNIPDSIGLRTITFRTDYIWNHQYFQLEENTKGSSELSCCIRKQKKKRFKVSCKQ
ncbi:unnamed protein product [Calicophoron daubneyi]|uniref:Uncharacterized protein n=1 Tax=Calicophoron daubneyi TaxID=300641 RepID=A0AAV2T1S9_CALDB